MFGFFKKNKRFNSDEETKEGITESKFNSFKNNLQMHLNSIGLFHNNIDQRINELHSKHHELNNRHDDNIDVVKQWIDFFNKKHKDTDDKIRILANYIKQLQETIDKNKIANETFVKQIIDEYVDIPKLDKDTLKQEIANELNFIENKVQKSNIAQVSKQTQEIAQTTLTNSEKWLLNVLFNSSEPITYDQIVAKTGKSLNTIRVYMNSLKNKGSLIEETVLPNGSKVFAITNKERVKKLYNINTL